MESMPNEPENDDDRAFILEDPVVREEVAAIVRKGIARRDARLLSESGSAPSPSKRRRRSRPDASPA
jgi:hypothetical protein